MAGDDRGEVSKGAYKRVFGVLFELTKLVNSGTPLSELLSRITLYSAELVGADTCSIMLLDETRQELLCKAAFGLDVRAEESLRFQLGEGVAGWVARNAAPALIPNVAKDPRFKVVAGQDGAISSLLCVPLVTKDGVIGTMSASSRLTGAFGKDHEELLVYLGASIVKDIENARLYRLSITDGLTKAYNRQYLYQRLPGEMERARRYADALSVILFDVDHFKRFNDTHGHPAGDFVLKELVRLTNATVRDVDGLVRYGGEEFLLLLPKTPSAGAVELAERLRAAVEGTDFLWAEDSLKVTLSLGVATLEPGDDDESFLRRADDLLYRAKQKGRNQVAA